MIESDKLKVGLKTVRFFPLKSRHRVIFQRLRQLPWPTKLSGDEFELNINATRTNRHLLQQRKCKAEE